MKVVTCEHVAAQQISMHAHGQPTSADQERAGQEIEASER